MFLNWPSITKVTCADNSGCTSLRIAWMSSPISSGTQVTIIRIAFAPALSIFLRAAISPSRQPNTTSCASSTYSQCSSPYLPSGLGLKSRECVVHSGIPTSKEDKSLIFSTFTVAMRMGQWLPGETAGVRNFMPVLDFTADRRFKCFNSFMTFRLLPTAAWQVICNAPP
jgi:hypothetical protein